MLDLTRMWKMLMKIWKRKMYPSGKLSHFASFSLEKLVATRRRKRKKSGDSAIRTGRKGTKETKISTPKVAMKR